MEKPEEHGDRKAQPASAPPAPADVGRALKTVYDDTLRENVPQDFLDLLGKLS